MCSPGRLPLKAILKPNPGMSSSGRFHLELASRKVAHVEITPTYVDSEIALGGFSSDLAYAVQPFQAMMRYERILTRLNRSNVGSNVVLRCVV